jgi:hypothetical protein
MNAGQRGGAYGFKLNSLLKLGDTKSGLQNRKHTLLHYLIDLVGRKFTECDGFLEELSHVEDGAKGKNIRVLISKWSFPRFVKH